MAKAPECEYASASSTRISLKTETTPFVSTADAKAEEFAVAVTARSKSSVIRLVNRTFDTTTIF